MNRKLTSPSLKRRRSPTPSDYYDEQSLASRHTMSPLELDSPARSPGLERGSSVTARHMPSPGGASLDQALVRIEPSQRAQLPTRSLGPEATEEQIFEALLQYVKSVIEPEPAWSNFFALKGLPQRVSVVLEQYRFVQSKIDDLQGRAPFQSPDHRIEKVCFLFFYHPYRRPYSDDFVYRLTY
jgi:hypothetical protein